MAAGGGSELNLTPFIDLFSVLICFLLMTAAWIELDSFQVQVEQKPKLNADQTVETPLPDENKKKEVQLSLHLERDKIIAFEDEIRSEFAIKDLDVNSPELKTLLNGWKTRFTDQHRVILHSAQLATYGQLIHLYDLLNYSGWTEIAINPY